MLLCFVPLTYVYIDEILRYKCPLGHLMHGTVMVRNDDAPSLTTKQQNIVDGLQKGPWSE